MQAQDLEDLGRAVALLDHPGLTARIASAVGTPVEKAFALLPDKATQLMGRAAHKAISAALSVALRTLDQPDPQAAGAAPAPKASRRWHLAATATSGALGGAFGAAALALELPVSTTLMLRSIADVARSEGADLRDVQTRLECIQVFALGGEAVGDDGAELGYFLAREAMSRAVSQAAAHLAQGGPLHVGAPAIVRLITTIAERYSITVSQKVAAQLVPVVGAVGGAVLNTLFMDHFQRMASGHFTVRRLERHYGAALVQEHYMALRAQARPPGKAAGG